MNYVKEYQIVIIFVCTIIILVSTPQAHATGYLSSPFKLKGTPTLCEIEPLDKKFPYIGIMMLSTTHDSINDWLIQLNKGLGNNVLWNINEVQIPLSMQKDYNYTTCDIQISYLPQPTNKTEILETVGTSTFDSEHHKVSIIVYYSEIVNKLIPAQNYGYDTVVQYSDTPMSYLRLKQTISHEIGHGLGLAHYHESNEAQIKKWIGGEEIPPSIMIESQGSVEKYFGVTQNDVEQIKIKYGKNGFGGKAFFGIPHEIEKLDNGSHIVQSIPTSTGQQLCPSDNSVVSGSESLLTKTSVKTGVIILSKRSPVNLYEKCKNLWTFDFVDEQNPHHHLSNVYYDIFIQQDSMRSLAKTQGKDFFFTANGTGKNEIEVTEREGVVYYWILVYTAPPGHKDKGIIGGSALVLLNVAHKTLQKTVLTQKQLDPWVKNIANWWSTGDMQDSEFAEAIHYLRDVGFIKINKVLSENDGTNIPSWLKQNAGWWARGEISDMEFFQANQFLIETGILKI